MTFGEFVNYLDTNPYVVVYYFIALPLTAYLACVFAKDEGHLSPWKYVYTALMYLAAVPGIFAILLNLYHMLFENQSIYEANILVQILPIISMIATFVLIKKNISYDAIPGFGKLTGLLGMVAAVMVIMFLINKTRLIAFTYVPVIWIVVALIVLFVLIRFGTQRLFK